MAPFLTAAIQAGSAWVILAFALLLLGIVVGLYTRTGSGISAHPYDKGGNGGTLGTDMPPETGREELDTVLWPRRSGRRARRRH